MRKVFLILGRTGCGKTTLAKKIIDKYRRTIAVDPLGEYGGNVFTDFELFCDYCKNNIVNNSGDFHIALRFDEDISFQYLFQVLWYIPDFLFILEEAEMFIDSRNADRNFLRLVRYGRHKDISLLCVARRVPEISIDFRAQCTSIVTYNQTEPSDLEKLEDYGFDMEEVKTLPLHEHVYIGENIEEKTPS